MDTKKYTSENLIAEQYVLRWSSSGWAVVFIDEAYGCISIQSDFGDYSYRWTSRGKDTLKQFIIGTKGDPDYVMRKFCMTGRHRDFDLDSTIKHFKEDVLRARREGDLTKYQAGDCWYDIKKLEDEEPNDANLCGYMLINGSYKHLVEHMYPDWDFPIYKEYSSNLKRFMEVVWPRIIDLFEKLEGKDDISSKSDAG